MKQRRKKRGETEKKQTANQTFMSYKGVVEPRDTRNHSSQEKLNTHVKS